MADQWMLRGKDFTNCNCDYGCPCQFGAPSTNGNCEAVTGGMIDEGNFNDVRLDGLNWAILYYWPGEIAQGNGTQQTIINEKATPQQREALHKILHGEATAPGATHFFVFNSTMSKVLDTLYRPVAVEIDVESRIARIEVPEMIESTGSPIIDQHSGSEHRAQIRLPNGFEYTVAEMGSGVTRARGAIKLDLSGTYGQFNILHMNQDGVIR